MTCYTYGMNEHLVESLAEPVGKLWQERQHHHGSAGEFFISSPLSSTPKPIYEWVVANAHAFTFWDRVRFVLMDEMMTDDAKPQYLPIDDPASYEGFARRHLLDPIRLATGVEIPIVKPAAHAIEGFRTWIDLLLLALGVQGNYANVMPGTPREASWHVANLTPEYRQVHTAPGSQSFAGAHFGERGMSLGPQQVLEAGHVALIISGERKKLLVQELLGRTAFDPEFPLSIVCERAPTQPTDLFLTKDADPRIS